MITPGHLTWPQLISKLTIGPGRLLGREKTKTLAPGTVADITLIDPAVSYCMDTTRFRSLGRNTPFHGRPVTGRVHTTIVDGEVRYTFGK